jgi:hypothetical protein
LTLIREKCPELGPVYSDKRNYGRRYKVKGWMSYSDKQKTIKTINKLINQTKFNAEVYINPERKVGNKYYQVNMGGGICIKVYE